MWTKPVRALVVTALVAGGTAAVVAAVAPDASAGPSAASTFHALTPTRLFDTRNDPAPQGIGSHGTKTFVVTGTHGPAGKTITIPSTATSVVLNVTVTRPAAAGFITVYGAGAPSAPVVSNLNFAAGQTSPNLVIAPVGSGGAVAFLNGAPGTVQLLADVTGYFAPDDSNPQGVYSSVTPTRLLDTRFGVGAAKSPIAAQHTVTFSVTGGAAGVPAGVSAVALNITENQASGPGYITAYAGGGTAPLASNLDFAKGQTVPSLAIVPVSASGKVTLFNGSTTGGVQLIADVQGYFMGGDPIAAGALGALAPARLLDTRVGVGAAKSAVKAGQAVTLTVAGRGGVPLTGVSAVILNITVNQPSKPGFIAAYPGTQQPLVSNVNFNATQTTSNLAVVPTSGGKVTLLNGSPGTVQLIADVAGYILSAPLPLPATSKARYVRNLHTGGGPADVTTMQAEGCADAASPLVVLDIGAQSNTLAGNQAGVVLSATPIQVTYAQLVTDLDGYLASYRSCGGTGRVAIATNNDGNFTAYAASNRGADWANQVIDALTVPSGVTVFGANDIESGFASTESQAELWVRAYLGATTAGFVYIGSADGCPTGYGATGGCSFGWTQAQYFQLIRGINPARMTAIPQIYTPALAVQWANIARVGGSVASIVGALTEFAACPTATTPGCTFAALPPAQGWAALRHTLSTVFTTVSLPYVADLEIDTHPVTA